MLHDYALIAFLFIVIIILICIIFTKTSKVGKQQKEIKDLKDELQPLSKFKTCVNAEKEAEFILSEANATSEQLIAKATAISNNAEADYASIIQKAEAERNSIISEAKLKVDKMKTDADNNLSASLSKAAQIIAEAEVRAKEIAGNAYDIAKEADYYKDLATAMRNIVEGYGDTYLKPSYSVLDDLAEDFGFTEAGENLKSARLVVKRLMSEGLAAQCDYVERNRKETAIAFVLDAFNGKVDSILSLIKKDNYGVLEQKIRDAFTVVNHLGSAFRNARITDQFLTARLNELKWGVAVVALKQQEREEQRIIKERIREEEKARREYEKAMREAAKQEEIIRKAIEKARAEIEKSSAEQKEKYELQLQELEAKLAEAEAKSQRALSMAQQTRSGHVYIISNVGSFGENVYKIGMTRRLEPLDRIRELGDASVPFPFDVHAMIYSEDAPTLETELHKMFAKNQVNKVNPRKEFFRLPLEQVKNYVTSKGVEVQWTLLAEAAQYRETLALEKSFVNNQQALTDWELRQDFKFKDLEDEEI